MPDAALLEAALTADGPVERSRGASPPLDFSVDPAWHDVFYDEPSEKRVRGLNTFLQAHPAQVVRLYHGTGASVPVLVKGLLPTSEGRRRSLQSAPGYVYLSVYPGMARTFGEMGYPGEAVAVYAVDIPVNQLRADLDQLRNQRLWAQRKVGDTLAESLAFGRGARVRGKISPDRIRLCQPVDRLPARRRASLETQLLALRPALAQAAQEVYDEWRPDEEEGDAELGFGGICDQVANAMSGVITSQIPDAEIEDGGWEGDDHAYLIVNRGAERYAVDIPPGVYERGGGYSWTKIESVTIEADDVIVEKI